MATWPFTNFLILRKWCGLKNQITMILFEIWPTNRFSNAKSYNFHIHKNDGTVTQSHGYRSYDVHVEGKVLRRNCVHLKPDKEVKITEPSLKTEQQNPKDQSAPPAHQSMHVKPTIQTAKTSETKCTNMELIIVKRTRSGRVVKTPQRYSYNWT